MTSTSTRTSAATKRPASGCATCNSDEYAEAAGSAAAAFLSHGASAWPSRCERSAPPARGYGPLITDPHDRTPAIGARLPHRWLPDGRSTLDLPDIDTFVTIEAEPGRVWLVRPDGHVAAHVDPARAGATLDTLVDRTAEPA
ncbi:MAG: hypothetical protein JO016_10830 [Actinobacteria bacterium]|nr:hypothetical protein [Actinomycetota bacterium]